MNEKLKEVREEIKSRILFMRNGGMEISPVMEIIISKEAELAFKSGVEYVYCEIEEDRKKFLQGFAYKKPE